MLSAIAARKAAQAANGHATSLPDPEPPVAAAFLPPSVEVQRSHSKPNSKRKTSTQTLNSSRKRKKKREVELKKTRYFEAESDPFQNLDDVIIVDSDEEDESDAPPAPITRSTVVGKRAWSPSAPINDSSDEEGEEILDVPVSLPPDSATAHRPSQPLTTFRVLPDINTFYLQAEEIATLGLSADTATLVSLSAGQTIGLLGTYMFTVLRGAVSMSGIRIPAAAMAHRVFAPRSSPIPILAALDEKVSQESNPAIPGSLRALFEGDGHLVVFHPLSSGVEGLGRICRTFDGVFKPSRWQQGNDANHDLRLPGVHMLTRPSKDIQPFILPPSWKVALNSVSDSANGVFFIKGHKKSGKSTFARTLLNRLLCRYRKVAFLECDLGQSEFTPGGLVALNIIERPVFGPPFTHSTIPNFAHYVGTTTPRSSPSQYLASIQALVETYQLDVQTPADADFNGDSRIADAIPLIVNTMGWTKGLGADLTLKIEDLVHPTDIFEVEAPFYEHSSSFEAAPSSANPPPNAKLHLLQPIAPSVLSTNYSASDHRSITILSYFHAIFPRTALTELRQFTATMWNTMLPLCAYPPYEVDWSLALDKITLCGGGTEDVVLSEIDRVLNGALVGLVSYEPGSLEIDNISGSTMGTHVEVVSPLPYTQGSAAPSPSTSMCHGLALIRAISPSSPHMHIITPLPPQLFSKCRVLVKGEMELPVWGMLDFRSDNDGDIAGVEKSKVPYMQWGKGEGLGGEKRRVRRNLMRKGQM
ncbi:hypothetical protein DFH07DRAFT_810597 [Mycena maculata]|uniref:Polynucleotide 5'-hydroxyl-kinase GRC3 n=1 Tax=Mycena maculata TaxID=230809 RepID=A0AAD7JID7_9AGAR|nr:hypothetical protein DFH07DRAFT_810597 [Mycena maculata]